MPKYDAFGREIGEDTLAGWRGAEDEPPTGAAAPADEPPRPAPAPEDEAAPPEPVVRAEMPHRRRRPRVVSRLVIVVVLIGVSASLVVNATSELGDVIPDVPGVEAEGPPPAGLQQGSLIRPAELGRALEQLRGKDLGRVYTLRLAPERIDAQLISGSGVLTSAQLRHDGAFAEFTRSPGMGHLDTIAWPKLNPGAPARLARRAAARLRQPVTRLNYLVVTTIGDRVVWGAYFKGGQIFQGDRRGRPLRRVS